MHLYSFSEQCPEFPHSYSGLGVLRNYISFTRKVRFATNSSSIMPWSLYITLQKIPWTYHDETIWRINNNLGQIPALTPQLLAAEIKPCALRSLILPSVSSIWLLKPLSLSMDRLCWCLFHPQQPLLAIIILHLLLYTDSWTPVPLLCNVSQKYFPQSPSRKHKQVFRLWGHLLKCSLHWSAETSDNFYWENMVLQKL